MSKLITEHFHGAALRHAPDATAFAHRRAGYSILIIAQWQDPGATAENTAWARETYDRLRPHAGAGGYTNYMGDDEARARVERLSEGQVFEHELRVRAGRRLRRGAVEG